MSHTSYPRERPANRAQRAKDGLMDVTANFDLSPGSGTRSNSDVSLCHQLTAVGHPNDSSEFHTPPRVSVSAERGENVFQRVPL